MGANADVGCAVFVALASRGRASTRSPLIRRPGEIGLGSDTLSVALPPVLVTTALTVAVYSLVTPAVRLPRLTALPTVSASVGATLPATLPLVLVEVAGGVAVAVGVGLGLGLAVAVAVAVGVGLAVAVAVGVGVG